MWRQAYQAHWDRAQYEVLPGTPYWWEAVPDRHPSVYWDQLEGPIPLLGSHPTRFWGVGPAPMARPDYCSDSATSTHPKTASLTVCPSERAGDWNFGCSG